MNLYVGITVIAFGCVLLVVAFLILRPRQGKHDEERPVDNVVAPDPPVHSATGMQSELATHMAHHRALQNTHQAAVRKIGNLERENEQLTRELAQAAKRAAQTNHREGTSTGVSRVQSGALIVELLQVADNIDRAIASANDGNGEGMDEMRKGMVMIQAQLLALLYRHHVHPLDAKGQAFDPHLHEAVDVFPTHELPDGTVVEEVQKGYLLDDKLLRPAMVTVSQVPLGGPATARGASDSGEGV